MSITTWWNPNIKECPINKRVHFLIHTEDDKIYSCIGTLTTNIYTGKIIRGECIEGNPKIFYAGDIIAWGQYIYE